MQSRSGLWSLRPKVIVIALLLAAVAGLALWRYVDRSSTPPRDSFASANAGSTSVAAASSATE